METIYDVFRVLVHAARGQLADTVINDALAIIDRHDAAVRTPPVTPAGQEGAPGA